MEPHFHAWLRSGRVFTMVGYARTLWPAPHTAIAEKLRPDKADRLAQRASPSVRSYRYLSPWQGIA